jgi:hypothetical protein
VINKDFVALVEDYSRMCIVALANPSGRGDDAAMAVQADYGNASV